MIQIGTTKPKINSHRFRLGASKAEVVGMKFNQQNLKEAKRSQVDCVIVRGLGDLVLRMERTEEEVARTPNRAKLLQFAKRHGLTVIGVA